ncbi:hypothetical protein D9757_009717 [Collybiopsis confluens]|uniref:Cytochrome P450 n=1 Tax=Collybiopsis confluens TaxID=2823264 RepID=A0A8H5H6R6_9AGAR|nr:hypothetical protein D9757_009717 [Collybiopsis confluens]
MMGYRATKPIALTNILIERLRMFSSPESPPSTVTNAQMIFQTLLASAVLYAGALVIYRVFLHPLRKYPGPVLAAMTEGYEAYYNIVKKGGLVTEIERLHTIHGKFFSVLHFRDKKAFHDIYTHGRTLIKEPQFYHGLFGHCEESSIGYSDPETAKARRSLLAPLFSRRAVVALEYTIQTKIDQLLTLLKENYNSPDSSLEISSAYRSLTLDIITSYCFAECTNALDFQDFSHPFIHGIQEMLQQLWIQRHFPFLLPLILHMPQKLVLLLSHTFKGYLELRGNLERQVDDLVKNTESLSIAEHETIYHHLLAPPKLQDRPSRKSLVDEAVTLVGAGTETTSLTIRQKILLELDEAWPDKDRPISFVVLEKLPYLTAFIRETLRFSPGVIHPLPRLTSGTTTVIGDWEVPPGVSAIDLKRPFSFGMVFMELTQTAVEMGLLSMHLNAEVFPDPQTFKPERWLTATDKDLSEMLENLSPFSKGPRICVGLNLAWCELYLIFANIFRKLDLTLLVTDDMIEDYGKNHVDALVPNWSKGYRIVVNGVRSEE